MLAVLALDPRAPSCIERALVAVAQALAARHRAAHSAHMTSLNAIARYSWTMLTKFLLFSSRAVGVQSPSSSHCRSSAHCENRIRARVGGYSERNLPYALAECAAEGSTDGAT